MFSVRLNGTHGRTDEGPLKCFFMITINYDDDDDDDATSVLKL